MPADFIYHAVTPDRWPDFERLFGPRGACGGCWCTFWKLPRSVHEQGKTGANREVMRAEIAAGNTPGLLAYAGDIPAGWCAIGPRAGYPGLERSRILKPVDERPVWSVTCFFIAKPYRRHGLSTMLLRAAVQHAAAHGAAIVEGYPVEPRDAEIAGAFAWTGLAASFQRAGFVEVARRSETRPIMRYSI